MMTTEATVRWTKFFDFGAADKQETAHSWAEFVEVLRYSGPYAAKSVCPWLKLATFGNERTKRGSLRSNSNMLEIFGVEGDYDGGEVTPTQAVAMLEKAGIRALVYTSPSHTPERPRWRVVAPLATPASPSDRSRLLARVNGSLGGILAGESFVPSQSYYFGRVMGQAEYLVLPTFDDPEDGECIDELHSLDEIAIFKTATQEQNEASPRSDFQQAVEKLGRQLRTGDGRREMLRSYIAAKSAVGVDNDDLIVLVRGAVDRYFDPVDPPNWADVLEMCAHFTATDAATQAKGEALAGAFLAGQEHTRTFKLKRASVDLTALRPIKWVLEGFVAAGEVVVYAGQPGVGKSTTFCALSLVVAGFGPEIGSDIPNDRPRRVVIVSEHAQQYERILFGFCKRYALDAKRVSDAVILYDAARLTAREIASEVAELVRVGTLSEEPPLIILDTASAAFELSDENSNAEVGAMIAALKKPVVEYGCGLWIIAHAAKALGREDSEITPRGASAYIGDVHGTGSVFRDKNFDGSTFIKSLKNRNERAYGEIEVRTEVVWHEVTDDRGVIQNQGIRLGVPVMSAESQRVSAANEQREAKAVANKLAARVGLEESVLRYLGQLGVDQWASKSEIADAIGKRKEHVIDACNALVEERRVFPKMFAGYPRYRLAE